MRIRSFIYIIIAGILWGTSGIFVHYLAPYGFSSLQMTAVRGTVSFVFIILFALVTDRTAFKVKLKELLIFALIGLSLFFTSYCYYTSMQLTSVSTAVVLMYAAPVYVMIVSVLFLGERLSRLKLLAVVLMLAGCCLVSGILGGARFDVLGIFMGFMAGVAYALYNIFTKIAMKNGSKPITSNIYSFATMSAVALCVSKPFEMAEYTAKAPSLIVPLLILLGVVTFVIPYFLNTMAMREIDAGTVSTLSIMEPMSATVFSVILFDERLSLPSVLGIAMILLAVFLLGMTEAGKKGDANEKVR